MPNAGPGRGLAITTANGLRGQGRHSEKPGKGDFPLHLGLDIWHNLICEMTQTIKGHLWGLNSTLTSNEQNKISKKGRKPKSVSPSIKVTATGRLGQQPHPCAERGHHAFKISNTQSLWWPII